VRQITLAAFVFMSIMCGLAAAHAMEASSGADTVEPPELRTATSKTSIDTSVSPPPSGKAEFLQGRAAPDCDGVAPSAGAVTALLSRFVRSSNTAHGVQCSIPPLPDQLTTQELHP
jgi:hypothetical protein